jgi:hypothetical protein
LEATRLTPHIEKHLAQEVLGKRLIADEPKKPAVDVGPMPGEQSLHCWFAASGSSDEVFPAVAASADTAATAAGCGRTDTLSMRGSPRSRFPPKQCWRPGCGSSFFRRQLQNTFCSCFSRPMPRSRNIVLVATVDRTESHARNSLPEHRASIAQPPVFSGVLAGAAFSVGAFNRKGQEPGSRFAHF